MSNGTKVIKRSGNNELLDLNKLHLMVEEACRDLSGVSASQVEMQSGIQFYDGITTKEIQEILIRSASDLIDFDNPNYQFVAARLLLFSVRKSLYGRVQDHPSFVDHIEKCVSVGVYDPEVLSNYTEEELNRLGHYIQHNRDYLFTYAGLRQVVDKYLVQDRSTGKVYETPQFMYMMIAATIFAKYPKETRISYVKRYYDAISKHKINIQLPLWQGLEHLSGNLLVVFLLMLMTPSIASSAVIWLLGGMLLKGQASASTQVASVASMLKSEVEKFSTQVLSLSSKSLKQLSVAALRIASEVDQQLSTSQSGTKKSKIF